MADSERLSQLEQAIRERIVARIERAAREKAPVPTSTAASGPGHGGLRLPPWLNGVVDEAAHIHAIELGDGGRGVKFADIGWVSTDELHELRDD